MVVDLNMLLRRSDQLDLNHPSPKSAEPASGFVPSVEGMYRLEKVLLKRYGIDSKEFRQAVVESGLEGQEGSTGGASASQDMSDAAKMALVQQMMGQLLGLTPSEVRAALVEASGGAAAAISAPSSPEGSSDATSPLSSSTSMVRIEPPKPMISEESYFQAITQAMDLLFQTKAATSNEDSQLLVQLYNDSLAQTQQKLQFMQESTRLAVEQLQHAIDTATTLRIVQYLVISLTLLITLIITAVTLGTAAPVVGVSAALVIAAVAATVSAAALITANELKRQGKLQGNDQIMDAIFWSLTALEIVLTLGAVSAAVATNAAVAVAVRQAIEDAGKEAAQDAIDKAVTIAINATKKTMQQVVTQLTTQVLNMMGTLIQIQMMRQDIQQEAKSNAQQEYDSSDAKAQVHAAGNAQINTINQNYAAHRITEQDRDLQIQAVNTSMAVQDASNVVGLTSKYVDQLQQRNETINWILTGVMLGISLGMSLGPALLEKLEQLAEQTMAASVVRQIQQAVESLSNKILKTLVGGVLEDIATKLPELAVNDVTIAFQQLVKNATEMAETGANSFSERLEQVMRYTEIATTAIEMSQGLVEGIAQVRESDAEIKTLRQQQDVEAMVAVVDASSELLSGLTQDIQQLFNDSQKGIGKIVEALSEAFLSSQKAFENIAQLI